MYWIEILRDYFSKKKVFKILKDFVGLY